MKKIEIADYLVDNAGLRMSQALEAVDNVFEAISRSLSRGENVYIRGFGTFRVITTKERTGRNISKGTVVRIPSRRTCKLLPGKALKSIMNK